MGIDVPPPARRTPVKLSPRAKRLADHGPSIEMKISLPPLIPGKKFLALVDTGASHCSIDETAAQELGLEPVDDDQSVSGIHGPASVNLYIAIIEVPGLQTPKPVRLAAGKLIEGNHPQSVILGRDFLSDFLMFYDGPSGAVQIARPSHR